MSEDMKTGTITFEITKEKAPFAPAQQLGEYTVKRWTWREKAAATSASRVFIDVKNRIIKFDTDIYYEQMILITVRKAPSGWNLDAVRDLDPDVGDALLKACLDVNELSAMEKTDFLGQFGSESPTLGSTPGGSAKPSDASQKQAD
jgi:hypothetical protein